MLSAKELYNIIYDNKIKNGECIEVFYGDTPISYLKKNNVGLFDKNLLIDYLFSDEFKFQIADQAEIEKKQKEELRKQRIEQLEQELARLKAEQKNEKK